MKDKLRLLKIGGLTVFNLVCIFSIVYVIVTNSSQQSQSQAKDIADTVIVNDFREVGSSDIYSDDIYQGSYPSKKKDRMRLDSKDRVYNVMKNVLTKANKDLSKERELKKDVAFDIAQAKQSDLNKTTTTQTESRERLLVDDFETGEVRNRLGSRANVYVRAPSRVMVAKRKSVINGEETTVLMIRYDKKNTGGPNGMGGWCGYYTLIKNERTGKYLDGSKYKYITFWVKGEKGGENFKLGLADEYWDKVGDSLKSEEIGVYLPEGKITPSWQKAKVPLDVFFLDYTNLSSITINFESECFPEGVGAGVIYIDDIALE